jgi:hypothetical protein
MYSRGLVLACTGSAVVAAAFQSGLVLAEQPRESLHLIYSAASECPDERAFADDVRRRTAAAYFVEGERDAREVLVDVRRQGDRFVGRIRMVETSADPSDRSFEDPDCAEVVHSLAVVLAVAVDPQALLGPPANAPTADPSPPTAPPRERRARASTAPAPVDPFRSPEVEPLGPRKATDRGLSGTVGGLAFIQQGIAPEPLVGAGILARASASQLSAALQGLAAQSGIAGPDAPSAEYRWFAVRLLASPLTVPASPAMALHPSVVMDLGAMTGTGEDVAYSRTQTGAWWSIGAGADVVAHPSKHVSMELSANFQVNLIRHRFVFERPYQVVHEVPARSFGVALGLGWNP